MECHRLPLESTLGKCHPEAQDSGPSSCQDRSWLEHTVSLLFPQTLPDIVFTEIKEKEN